VTTPAAQRSPASGATLRTAAPRTQPGGERTVRRSTARGRDGAVAPRHARPARERRRAADGPARRLAATPPRRALALATSVSAAADRDSVRQAALALLVAAAGCLLPAVALTRRRAH
jgi:hypothetical protein